MDHHKKKKRRRRRRRRRRREKTAASLCGVSLPHCCCLFDWNINGGVFSTDSQEDKQTDRKQSAVSGSDVDICSWRLYSYLFIYFYKLINSFMVVFLSVTTNTSLLANLFNWSLNEHFLPSFLPLGRQTRLHLLPSSTHLAKSLLLPSHCGSLLEFA